MARILVTGGAGFLGFHLTSRLLEGGHHVVIVDDLSTGSEDNLSRLPHRDRLEVHRADVASGLSMDVDQIFHLACPASPVHYQADSARTIETAVLGTRAVLELARDRGARVVVASTSEIYGEPEVHPQPESYWGNVNPVGPRACYDEGKRCAEALVVAYVEQRGVDARVARIFNTYGPAMRADDGRVVSNFVLQALRNEPLTIYGDGAQTRSFCYVSDLVDGLMRLMDHDTNPGPVNLGNPAERTIAELASAVLALTGSTAGYELEPLPVDDPTRRQPNITRAQEVLGWSPRVGLEDGLVATIDDFRRRYLGVPMAQPAMAGGAL